jgi:hypothetical protein
MQRFWLVLTLAIASLLGLLAIVAPVWILDLRRFTAPLFPLVRSGVEGMSLLTLVFLFCAGFLVGCFGVGHPLLLGMATVALLPILAIAEMSVSSTTHNLWPLEFIMYGVISLCAVAGAFAGRFAKRLVRTTQV